MLAAEPSRPSTDLKNRYQSGGSHPAAASAPSIADFAAGGWAVENTEATMNPPRRTTRRISTSATTGSARWLSTNAAAAPSTASSTSGNRLMSPTTAGGRDDA